MKPTQLERELLLSWITRKDRVWLKTHPEYKLSFFENIRLRYALYQRKKNIPMAYIIGYKDWAGMRLKVNKNTLIPRDETEILCEHIQTYNRDFQIQSVLDIGTGSGAIALNQCKVQGAKCKVMGVDISKKALKVATENAVALELDVEFKYSDLLSGIDTGRSFDVIVANLPYVPQDMVFEDDLRAEPHTAIFSGSEGLDHIQRLAQGLQEKKIVFRELWLEFLPQQAQSIEQIFYSIGEVELKKDLSGQVFFACVKKRN